MEWQVVAGLEEGELIVEKADAKPSAAVEVREYLPDGTGVQGRLVTSAPKWRRQTCHRSLFR